LSTLVADAADDPPTTRDAGTRTAAARWPDPRLHRAAVEACLDQIAAGEIYQANVCLRVELPPIAKPLDLFAAGLERLVPARAAYLGGSWGAAASFSPELFLASRAGVVRSSPIKGTRPRTASPAELLGSEKDRAENIMITDMVRNDLGRVAVPGSVTVPELLAVRAAPGVWHLVSTVAARLRDGLAPGELLAAAFPPASVTGTPKLRAIELLAGWEPAAREIYCGAIGMASPVAGLELSVAIRTAEVAADGTAWLGVGGGITIDSDPAAEWQECLDKAAPVLGLLGAPEQAVRRPGYARGAVK
jgi:para-aminobenzoate synthetase component 1